MQETRGAPHRAPSESPDLGLGNATQLYGGHYRGAEANRSAASRYGSAPSTTSVYVTTGLTSGSRDSTWMGWRRIQRRLSEAGGSTARDDHRGSENVRPDTIANTCPSGPTTSGIACMRARVLLRFPPKLKR